jgi:hypothetical protein
MIDLGITGRVFLPIPKTNSETRMINAGRGSQVNPHPLPNAHPVLIDGNVSSHTSEPCWRNSRSNVDPVRALRESSRARSEWQG